VLELLFPAQRGQPWRPIGFNFPYTPLSFSLTFLALPPLSAVTAPWVQSLGGWMPIRLPDSAWGLVLLALPPAPSAAPAGRTIRPPPGSRLRRRN